MSRQFPLFWLHFGGQNADDLLEVLDDLSAPDRNLGMIGGPHSTTNYDFSAFQRAREKAPAFFDPHGHFVDLKKTSGKRQTHYPCIDVNKKKFSKPTSYTSWMADCIEVQESNDLKGSGKSPILIATPSRLIEDSGIATVLYPQVDAASSASSALEIPKWIGISIKDKALKDVGVRTRIANRLVEIPAQSSSGIMLRLFCPPYLPITNNKFLVAARELIEGLVGHEHKVFMPSSGWFGWLSLAWGAEAFSAGLSSSSTWNNSLQGGPPGTTGGDPENFFEAQLLRRVPWKVHLNLASRRDYFACPCQYCSEMGSTWDAKLAMKHQLWWVAREANVLEPLDLAGRRKKISKRLKTCADYRDGLPAALKDQVNAGFLDVWANNV